ncbi:MAG: hypothetical protein AAF609_26470 [Cyanobacteria bacterium P01_C01_bin.120]
MINIRLSRSQQKLLFLLGVTLIYLSVITYLDFLTGPAWEDEGNFWDSSLTFSDSLIPTLTDLRTYDSLNTPLPFILFGWLEYFLGGGMAAGRWFNLFLSLGIVAIIGWPTKQRGTRAILCLIGLFMCPYFLWLSGRLYTEMVACTCMLLGIIAYVNNRHLLSGLAFILAIAARQYMLAFPVAIAIFEFLRTAQDYWQTREINWHRQIRWLAPSVAALTILGWFAFFDGLAPPIPTIKSAPEVQKSLWAFETGAAINFLAFVGGHLVIPELILFPPQRPIQMLKKEWKKWLLIAVLLLLFCLLSLPRVNGYGAISKAIRLFPGYGLQIFLYYGLALLTCIRFAKPDLMFWLVIVHAAMMTKAWPWDRYVLPLAITFWYFKSMFPGLIIPSLSNKSHGDSSELNTPSDNQQMSQV